VVQEGGTISEGATAGAATNGAGIRLLVVDDSRLVREALASVLRSEAWVAGVETAPDSASALRHAIGFPPTVTLLNMTMAKSIDSLRTIAHSERRARVVSIGVSEDAAEIIACAEAGAAGYLLRRDPLSRLQAVIQCVAKGEALCSPRVAATLLGRVTTLAAERGPHGGFEQLTAREYEVLTLLEDDLSNREIAERLCIEVRTVKNHVHSILDKLGVDRRGRAGARLRAERAQRAI
jgi:DNA-binding NarL/FixJ family response regulator